MLLLWLGVVMHGGDVYRNHIKYDFSVNINPLGLSGKVKKAFRKSIDKLEHYPDSECEKLTDELGELQNVSSRQIVCGNGASELIGAIIRAAEKNGSKILLPSPGFSGYEAAIESCIDSDFFTDKILRYHFVENEDFDFSEGVVHEITEKLKKYPFSIVIITNPNNPNGKLFSVNQVRQIADLCKDTKLLIDESFIELSDSEQSFVPFLKDYQNVVILRSFTKSFAIPGIRLGYCITGDAVFAQKIKKQLSEWNVSVVAQEVGLACIKEIKQKKYLKKSVELIRNEREFLKEELQKMNYRVYGSDVDFLLFYSDKSGDLHNCPSKTLAEYLLEKRILIRDCSDYEGLSKGFYRISVKTHKENKILVREIRKYKKLF